MTKVLAITFILLNSISAIAQSAGDWQKFSPGGEEFVVEVPDKLSEVVTVLKDNNKQNIFAYGKYRTYFNGVYYFIFSEIVAPDSDNKFPVLSDNIHPFIKKYSESPEYLRFGRFIGKKYKFKDNENFFHTIIFLKTEKRFYTFHTISEESPANETKRFFKSLNFQDISTEVKEQSFEELQRKITSARNNNNNINISPNASGTGGNSGAGNGPTSVQPIQTSISQAKGLQIYSKPRANYTDLARDYEITGLVQLKVTFLESGEIGVINPVKRLPFGLTNEAIYAAKQITFEPAIFDGKKVTVTRQVHYSFTLF